jgi:translation initiation factor eIF-2B subunit epsilon
MNDFAQQEDPLTAIILIDTFDRAPGTTPTTVSLSPEDRPARTFAPLTLDKPRCLLPVCGVAMIEWVLEWCIAGGVRECVLVASGWEATQIKSFFESRWNPKQLWQSNLSGGGGLKLKLQTFPTKFLSIGDALRELDSISSLLPQSNFLLVSCDMIANWDIAPLVEDWKNICKMDKESLMATCCTGAGSAQKSSIQATPTPLYVTNANGKLIRYISEELFPDVEDAAKPRYTLDKDDFLKAGEAPIGSKNPMPNTIQGLAQLQVKTGSVETGVDIITPEVLALFTENFDYNTLRQDFVRGVLSSPVLSKSFYVFDVSTGKTKLDKGHYSARCVSTATWHAVQEDIMRRRTFPLVATNGAIQEYRTHVYRDPGVMLPPHTTLTNCVLINPSCKFLGPNISIRDVVTVGHACEIDEGVVIVSSHLMESVKVGKHCRIRESILGNNVTLLDGVVLNRGCVVGDGCILGPHVVIPPFTKITRHSPAQQKKIMADLGWRDDWGTDLSEDVEHHPPILGHETNAWMYILSDLNTAKQEFGDDPDEFGDGDSEHFDLRNVLVGELGRTLEDLIKLGPLSVGNVEENMASPHSYRKQTPDIRPKFLERPIANPSTHAPTPTPHHRYHKIHNIYMTGYDPDWSEDEGRKNDTESSDEELGPDHTALLSASLSQISLANVQETKGRALNEIRETLIRHLKQDKDAKLNPDTVASSGVADAVAEVSTARMAENLHWDEVRACVIACLVDYIVDALGQNPGGKQVQSEVEVVWSKWGDLIEKLCFEEADKIGVVGMLLDHISQHYSDLASKTFLMTLKTLYDNDVVDEGVILKWWAKPLSNMDGKTKKASIRRLVEPFVEWLENAEEESEESK